MRENNEKKRPWEKCHCRHQGQGRMWYRRTGCNSLSPCHGLLGREGGRKKQEKMSESEPVKKRGKDKEASVLILFLTILLLIPNKFIFLKFVLPTIVTTEWPIGFFISVLPQSCWGGKWREQVFYAQWTHHKGKWKWRGNGKCSSDIYCLIQWKSQYVT